jgi:hypothetical protein
MAISGANLPGETNNVLLLKAGSTNGSGDYRIVVRNSAGSISATNACGRAGAGCTGPLALEPARTPGQPIEEHCLGQWPFCGSGPGG